MPVMKVECNAEMNKTRVDITVKDVRHKGIECAKLVKSFLAHYSCLEPLLLVFKNLLKISELNDPYTVHFKIHKYQFW